MFFCFLSLKVYSQLMWFILLHKVVQLLKSVDETLVCGHSNESYCAVLSCGTVCYAVQGLVVLTFKPVDETLVCGHSNGSYRAARSRGTINFAVHGCFNFLIRR